MSSPTDRNRLVEEESPYLRAHADNPVNWQPWDESALAAAKESNVPIFLSIGYAACHWCHVMAEESFEDEDIARTLNEDFVPIKVDREERPAVDSLYMTVCRLVNRRGCGWPLSVWLTPDAKPFFVGTYFPRESERGQPGFGDLLEEIKQDWAQNREELENRADRWMRAARNELESVPPPKEDQPGPGFLREAADALENAADRVHGGFGHGQKFPQPPRLHLLARASHRFPERGYESVLTETLDAMITGGLRDHLGGGFHRYCTDREWTVPHFEKMLYDNAGIPLALLAGYQLTGNERYADVVSETFAFLERELSHPEGGFYSSLDARSPPPDTDVETQEVIEGRGVEGAYYTWTPDGVGEAMREFGGGTTADADPDVLSRIVCRRYGITGEGNFQEGSVLTESADVDTIARSEKYTVEEVTEMLEEGMKRLRAARDDRPRPPRDEKVIAAWNGLTIEALAEAAIVLGNEAYADRARSAVSFVQEHLWDGDRLGRRYIDRPGESETPDGAAVNRVQDERVGDVKGAGTLSDYALLARGALRVYEATGDVGPLSFAVALGRAIVSRFWDGAEGRLYVTPADGDPLPVRPQDVADQALPSATGAAVEVLQALEPYDENGDFAEVAKTIRRTYSGAMESSPAQYPTLIRSTDTAAIGPLEVTIAADEIPAAWLDAIGSRYLPGRLVTRRPPTREGLQSWVQQLGRSNPPRVWAHRDVTNGPTAYVCRNACSPPITDRGELVHWLDEYDPVVRE
ncbi:MAG: thioredoxin domain-containing protein [Halodesulfurarchaeum sp.]